MVTAAAGESGNDWAARVRGLLLSHQGPLPSQTQAARQLHVSPRSLRRYLAAHKCCYQQLLDQERCRRALNYLRDGAGPLTELGYELGFSDPSNFRRAFKKWTGLVPGSFRD